MEHNHSPRTTSETTHNSSCRTDSLSTNGTGNRQVLPRRKIRLLIISMGGPRQEALQEFFSRDEMLQDFELPTFCPGIPSRCLRNRESFFQHIHDAGLLPELEWEALSQQNNVVHPDNADDSCHNHQQHADSFFDCLHNVPVMERRGSDYDRTLHYAVEIWRKAKTINRGRSVLACMLAHLMAMQKLVAEKYDLLLEDNVRFPVQFVAERIHQTIQSVHEWEKETGRQCHIRYFGWLGSTTNLKWIYTSHMPRTQYKRSNGCGDEDNNLVMSCFPMPTLQDVEQDLAHGTHKKNINPQTNKIDEKEVKEDPIWHKSDTSIHNDTTTTSLADKHETPGGNPVWGTYAYWISETALDQVMEVLRTDVGAFLWKSKRMRCYLVKPIDKILPRQIRQYFGPETIQLATHPTFFRAPMLTSKIHTQYDPEFCKSTTAQLQQTGLDWSNLSLTEQERKVVTHYEQFGQWQTTA